MNNNGAYTLSVLAACIAVVLAWLLIFLALVAADCSCLFFSDYLFGFTRKGVFVMLLSMSAGCELTLFSLLIV